MVKAWRVGVFLLVLVAIGTLGGRFVDWSYIGPLQNIVISVGGLYYWYVSVRDW